MFTSTGSYHGYCTSDFTRVDPNFGAATTLRSALGRRLVEVGIGAALVALAAQVAVPVPFSPVPMTLQPLAVLAVGGLLGAAGGVAALATYLALGMLGLPVVNEAKLPPNAVFLVTEEGLLPA